MELVELAQQVELEEAVSRASGTYGNNTGTYVFAIALSAVQTKVRMYASSLS